MMELQGPVTALVWSDYYTNECMTQYANDDEAAVAAAIYDDCVRQATAAGAPFVAEYYTSAAGLARAEEAAWRVWEGACVRAATAVGPLHRDVDTLAAGAAVVLLVAAAAAGYSPVFCAELADSILAPWLGP